MPTPHPDEKHFGRCTCRGFPHRGFTAQRNDPGRNPWLKALAALVGLGLAAGAVAVDEVEFDVEAVEGANWSARDVSVALELEQGRTSAVLQIARMEVAGMRRPLMGLRIACPTLELSASAFVCERATVRLTDAQLGRQSFTTFVRYGRDGALELRMTGLRLGAGAAALEASLRRQEWTAALTLKDASLSELSKLIERFAGLEAPVAINMGRITLSASLGGSVETLSRGSFRAQVAGLTLNNPSGSIAAEKLALEMTGAMERAGTHWRFNAEVNSGSGQAYAEPIFADLSANPLAARVRGAFTRGQRVVLEELVFDHAEVAHARGHAEIDLAHEQPLRALDLSIRELQFPGAYEKYLQPFLLNTAFKAMQTSGALAGRVEIVDGDPRALDVQLSKVAFHDGAQRLALRNLNGRWRWRATEGDADEDEASRRSVSDMTSDLRWDGGVMLGLDLGAAQLDFSTVGRSFRLLAPARIPVLDGAVRLETFRVRSAGTPQTNFLVDASLEPISVERLCKAFGWPEFGGKVGGAISKLRMREGVITLGAALDARVFDGAVSINDLRLEEPFSQWPRLEANISLENLDLELVTRAFSFGRITGRLSGSVQKLQLFNWTPVAFDARLHTPPGDRSRHRISQRAVQNIGNIGGGGAGVGAALSSGFLRFFEDFNYERLGIGCRLENEICEMRGVGPAPNGGYYLVKGRGVPRIDVIGNARRVDWPRLVQQLIAMTEAEAPVVR